jgi:hypothetical protein
MKPAWVVYDLPPGVPVPEAGEPGPAARGSRRWAGSGASRPPRSGASPQPALELDQLRADPPAPGRIRGWLGTAAIHHKRRPLPRRCPRLVRRPPRRPRPRRLHPVNILTDGAEVTRLPDFEAARLADPLLDAAWWAWSVSFSRREYSSKHAGLPGGCPHRRGQRSSRTATDVPGANVLIADSALTRSWAVKRWARIQILGYACQGRIWLSWASRAGCADVAGDGVRGILRGIGTFLSGGAGLRAA